MIPKMRKFLFAGARDVIDQFFARAQSLGQLEFVAMTEKKQVVIPPILKELNDAIKILRWHKKCPQKSLTLFDARTEAKKVNFYQKEIETFREEERYLQVEIARIQPLGNFSVEEIEKLRDQTEKKLQFFVARHSKVQGITLPEGLIYISTAFDQVYFLYIGSDVLYHHAFTEMVVKTSLGTLIERLKVVRAKITDYEEKVHCAVCFRETIVAALREEMNRLHLHEAKDLVDYEIEGFVFFVEAWIAETHLTALSTLLEELPVICQEVTVQKGEVIPTSMDNKGFAAVGEDLVRIYDTPTYTDKDPSGWVLWAFALFFAMIIADAGYGFLYLLVAMVLWIKCPHWKGRLRRFKKLLTILSCFCITWGVLTGSYFSIKLAPNNPVNQYSILYHLALKKVSFHMDRQDLIYRQWVEAYPALIDVDDPRVVLQKSVLIRQNRVEYKLLSEVYDNLLLEFALIVGILHISLGMLRHLRVSTSGIGWIMVLLGGYLFFPSILGTNSIVNYLGLITPDMSTWLGLRLLLLGLGSAIVIALIQEKWKGVGEVVKLIQIFADTLSYLRLYALGMASMIMAGTFNELGKTAGWIFGIIIILLGHTVNIGIGIMGGVIHGLRLNFLEWYHYCFTGGGRPFKPLKVIK